MGKAPDGIVVVRHAEGLVSARTTRARLTGAVLGAERRFVENAVPARQDEFLTVRHCARTALGRLRVPAHALLPRQDRTPTWPPGVVGSLTHCEGMRLALVGASQSYRAVGVDAEPWTPLPGDVEGLVVTDADREFVRSHPDPAVATRVVFSAKEAVFKALHAIGCAHLADDPHLVGIRPFGSPASIATGQRGVFVGGPVRGGEVAPVTGRWMRLDGCVVTGVVIPMGPVPGGGGASARLDGARVASVKWAVEIQKV